MPPHFLKPSSKPDFTERLLLALVDLGLILALLVVPMILGGNHAWGRLMLVVAAGLSGTAWAARQAIRRERFFPGNLFSIMPALVILGLGLLIPIVQLVPLPEAIRNLLSPHLAEILPLWQSSADPAIRLGSWRCLSLTPSATQAGLVTFAAYSLLFLVVVGRVQTIKDLQRLLRWCGGTVLLVAIFAIVQHFFGNGKFFWFYEHPYRIAGQTLSGPFVNRNHFAQFMALGIGPLLIWIVSHASTRSAGSRSRSAKIPTKKISTKKSERSPSHSRFDTGIQGGSEIVASIKASQFMLAMMAGLVVFACLLSLSRGGSTAMLLAVLVCCGISFSVKGAIRQMFSTVVMASVILGASLMIFGYDKVCTRLGNLTSGKVELMDVDVGRRAIWETDLRATSYFPLLGTGIGSHAEVYPIFFDYVHNDYCEFTHAENGYIQTLLETGGIGAILLLTAISTVGFWCINGLRKSRSDQLRLCLAAISAAIVATLFHSMTDFIWYIPGCATMAVVMAACAFCAYRLAIHESCPIHGETIDAQRQQQTAAIATPAVSSVTLPSLISKTVPPWTAWGTVGAILLVTLAMFQQRIGPAQAQPYWDDYLRAEQKSTYHEVVFDKLPPKELQEAARFYRTQIERLKNVVRFDPGHARAHQSLALTCLKLFDVYQVAGTNPMSLTHIGDAAIHSEFESREALVEWLHRAFGKHVSLLKLAQYHALCSVRACPTVEGSYLYLTELCFLDRFSFEQKKQLIDQALLVRPRSGQSVLALARDALVAGDYEQWAELSKRVFRMNLDSRRLVLRNLLENTQTDMLPVMIAIAIQQFEPDHEAALYMLSLCQKRIPEDQLADLRRYCATQALRGLDGCTSTEKATRRLVVAQQYQKLGETEAALPQLRMAYECDPNNFGVRQYLALALLENGSPSEAKDHFQWCLRRKPGNQWLEKMYRDALAAHLDAQARSAHNKEVTTR